MQKLKKGYVFKFNKEYWKVVSVAGGTIFAENLSEKAGSTPKMFIKKDGKTIEL